MVSDSQGGEGHEPKPRERQSTAVFEDARHLIHGALVAQFHLDDAAATKFETNLYVWFRRFCMRSGERSPQELRSVLLAACWEFARRSHGSVPKKETGTRAREHEALAETIRSRSSAGPAEGASSGIAPSRELTNLELEIIDGMSRGFRNKEIGRRLEISEKAVETYVEKILRKLQIDGRSTDDLIA